MHEYLNGSAVGHGEFLGAEALLQDVIDLPVCSFVRAQGQVIFAAADVPASETWLLGAVQNFFFLRPKVALLRRLLL